MTKMTAVEWLLEELKQLDKKVRSYNTIDYIKIIKERQSIVKQANEMFEQQIIDAATWGALQETGEQYYSETYKKENQ